MDSCFTVSNPKIDTTPLPHDQSVSLLEEAREYYVGSEPPFVARNTGKNANGNVKRVVLATADGKYPQQPVTVDCTHRLWSKSFTYATVDLNGKRRIVKSRSGGPNGGSSYTLWRGVDKRFAERPVGFSQKDPSGRQGTSTPTDYSLDGSPPRKKIFRASKPIVMRDHYDDSITSSPYEGTPDLGPDRPHITTVSLNSVVSSSADEGNESDSPGANCRSTTVSTSWSFPKSNEPAKTSAYIPATPISPIGMGSERPRKYSTARNHEADDYLLDMMLRGYTMPAICAEWNKKSGYETTQAAWKSRYWRLNNKGLTGGLVPYGYPGREMRKSQDAGGFDSQRGIRFCAVNSRHNHSTSPDAYYKQASSTPEASFARPAPPSIQTTARQASELSMRQSIESPALADAGAGANSSSTIYSHLMTPHATPTEVPSISKIIEIPSGEPFALAPNKLARTTLRIADLSTNTYTPLKLRSCTTISALFAKVLDICGLETNKEGVEALKMTFEWLGEGDEERTMLLKERYEDSFEYLMEMVDEAPCWEQGGKCTVGVEAVMREGSGVLKRKASVMEFAGSSRTSVVEGASRKGSVVGAGSRKPSEVLGRDEVVDVEMEVEGVQEPQGESCAKPSINSNGEQADLKLSSYSAGQAEPMTSSGAGVMLMET